MKLNHFIAKPLDEAIKDLELVETKIHTNPDNGELKCVELIYKPSNQKELDNNVNNPWA